MRFLIDTHVFLWFINGDAHLPQTMRAAIEDEENEVLLSIASVWEIAIKTSVGKLGLAKPFAELIPEQIIENEIELIPINMDDLKIVATLPFLLLLTFDAPTLHSDPLAARVLAPRLTSARSRLGRRRQSIDRRLSASTCSKMVVATRKPLPTNHRD